MSKIYLESFLGLLNHAASVAGPGQTFMRGLIDMLPCASAPHHHIRLNTYSGGYCSLRNGMVSAPSQPSSLCIFYLRCFRLLELRCCTGLSMDSDSVAKRLGGREYSHQGTCSNCSCNGCMYGVGIDRSAQSVATVTIWQ